MNIKTGKLICRMACLLLLSCNKGSTDTDESLLSDNVRDITKEKTVLTLAADAWLPFNGTADTEPEGFMLDVAREVFDSRGIEIRYINTSWSRAIKGTEEGLFDGAVGASIGDGENLVFPGQELGRGYLAFYVQSDEQWTFEGIDSLSGKSLGVIESYDYRPWLGKYIRENNGDSRRIQVMSGENPLEQNIMKLVSGRVDVVVGNESTIRFAAKKLGILEKIKPAGYDDQVAFLYIGFSPANPRSEEYARILSDGINELRLNGRLGEILDRYGLKDWI